MEARMDLPWLTLRHAKAVQPESTVDFASTCLPCSWLWSTCDLNKFMEAYYHQLSKSHPAAVRGGRKSETLSRVPFFSVSLKGHWAMKDEEKALAVVFLSPAKSPFVPSAVMTCRS